jgi:ribosome maturation factor RimP
LQQEVDMVTEKGLARGSAAHRSGKRGGEMVGGPRADGTRSDVDRLLAPIIERAGMDLEAVEITPAGRRQLLRVVVDRDGGVDLDDVAGLSHDLSQALDASAVMGERPYTLEVTSPGVDRPLTQPRHWRRAVGRLVAIPSEPGADTVGRVTEADENGVVLDVDGDGRRYAYSELPPGRVEVEFRRREGGAR